MSSSVFTVAAQAVLSTAFDTSSVNMQKNNIVNPQGVLQNDPATGTPYAFVTAGSTINSVDALNSGYRCIYQFTGSWDNGKTYQSFGPPYEWLGGSTDRSGNPTGPNLSINIPTGSPDGTVSGVPNLIRVSVDPETFALNMGVTVSFKA